MKATNISWLHQVGDVRHAQSDLMPKVMTNSESALSQECVEL